MCKFHKWSKWEEYKWEGIIYPGRLYPEVIQGKPIRVSEMWQKRACKKCGKTQRVRTDL